MTSLHVIACFDDDIHHEQNDDYNIQSFEILKVNNFCHYQCNQDSCYITHILYVLYFYARERIPFLSPACLLVVLIFKTLPNLDYESGYGKQLYEVVYRFVD